MHLPKAEELDPLETYSCMPASEQGLVSFLQEIPFSGSFFAALQFRYASGSRSLRRKMGSHSFLFPPTLTLTNGVIHSSGGLPSFEMEQDNCSYNKFQNFWKEGSLSYQGYALCSLRYATLLAFIDREVNCERFGESPYVPPFVDCNDSFLFGQLWVRYTHNLPQVTSSLGVLSCGVSTKQQHLSVGQRILRNFQQLPKVP